PSRLDRARRPRTSDPRRDRRQGQGGRGLRRRPSERMARRARLGSARRVGAMSGLVPSAQSAYGRLVGDVDCTYAELLNRAMVILERCRELRQQLAGSADERYVEALEAQLRRETFVVVKGGEGEVR